MPRDSIYRKRRANMKKTRITQINCHIFISLVTYS